MASSFLRGVGSAFVVCAGVAVGCTNGTSTLGHGPSGGSSLCHCNAPGAACTVSDDCQMGYYCGPADTCVKAGTGTAGTPCSSDGDCASGLRCDVTGFFAQCEPEGTVNIGGTCKSSGDCLAGLACVSGSCDPLGPSEGGAPIAVPTWPGETCTDVSGPTQAYFRVPRGTDDGDFYRLPFPNDVRVSGGKVSLKGHPTPGPALLGFDVVDRWLRDLEATVDGFSTFPTVYFRFSAPVDIGGTLKAKGAVQFVDITTPAKPATLGYTWVANTERGAYICDNWMALKPPAGTPLTPGHTYAVIIASTVKDANGAAIQSSTDLQALLASSTPSDATLAAAWNQYAPLRAWASAAGVSAASILAATQFTVGHPAAIGPKLASAVAAASAPTAASWIRCGDKPSPCPQATGDRACGTPDPSFDELHALITLPIFQKGNEPYATPTDGGDFALASDGTPQLQRTEQVCMALTVPKGTMPSGGWPLLVYAHGTGGSFRSHVTEGVAKREAAQGIAVLGIDQVEHGTRRGTSQTSPDQLFYDFSNPLAARGNPLQGAADQMALARFASSFDLPAGQSPTAAEIKAGPVAFWGHSQGATEGGIAMPYTPGVVGAVLSGEGASLEDALVGKTNPVNIAAALPIVLEDAHVDTYHPVLALLQNDLGLVDPLNHAGALVQTPVGAAEQKHVFQPFGQGDTYAPPTTEQIFAIAAHLTEAAPPSGVSGKPLVGMTPSPVPLGGNAMVAGKSITAVVRQYAPGASYDGHFVAYDDATAEADVDHFLADALAGKVPMVGR